MNTFSIHVLSAYREGGANFAAARTRAALERGDIPGCTYASDPDLADTILFLEHHPDGDPFYLDVLRHPFVRRFRGKCLLCHDNDFVTPFLPGFYCSLLRRDYRPGLVEPWVYLSQQCTNPAIRYSPPTGAEPLLFSFIGAAHTHPVRREILRLTHPNALLVDTSGNRSWQMGDSDLQAYRENFARSLADSLFVLCPRGMGPNSYRLCEAMQAGRVPVIISDDFVPAAALPWAQFALFVPEALVPEIPARLADAAPLAPAMGRAARAAWERWCAWPTGFAELAGEMRRLPSDRHRTTARRPFWLATRLVFSSPRHARLLARSLRHRARRWRTSHCVPPTVSPVA